MPNLRDVCDQPCKHIQESNLIVQCLLEPVAPGNPRLLLTVRFRLQSAKPHIQHKHNLTAHISTQNDLSTYVGSLVPI